jgi:pSer/pThr/pTyr-binding forkhead associated (FHA) protein
MDVQLIDDGISRTHAKIIRDADGSAKLVDLDSTNGTYINGRRIHAEGLREGDRIRVGQSAILDFRYEYRDSSMLISEDFGSPDDDAVPTPIQHAMSQEIPADAAYLPADDEEQIDSEGNPLVGGASSDPIAAYQRTLQIREMKFGKDHPAVASILDSLGAALQDAGDVKAALECHQRALKIYQGRARPPRETGHVMANVGRCQLELGDGESALRSFEQAHAMLRGRGASSVELARVRFSMSQALYHLERDRDRMVDLARLARDAFAAGGASTRASYQEVVAWLRARGAS